MQITLLSDGKINTDMTNRHVILTLTNITLFASYRNRASAAMLVVKISEFLLRFYFEISELHFEIKK